MDSPVTTKAALLLVLLDGPGYGLDLAERVSDRTNGRIRLLQGSLYPALRKFEESGWVEVLEDSEKKTPEPQRKEPPKEHGGRPKIYYRITKEGRKEAQTLRSILLKVSGVP